MKRLMMVVSVVALLIATALMSGMEQVVLANSNLKNRLSEVQKERSAKQSEVKQTESELHKVEQEIHKVDAEIRRLDEEVAITSEKVHKKTTEVEEVRLHIEQLKEELVIIEQRITERDELLKERARTMYQSGGSVSYLEVLLGAKSFGDFLDRLGALSMIAEQDRNILDAHIEDQRLLEETKAEVEVQLAKLEAALAELESLQEKLEGQRAQKDQLMKDLEAQEGELHENLGALEDEAKLLAAQEAAIKKELEAYNRRKAQAQKGNGTTHQPPEAVGAGFMRPATGKITSTFGPRWGSYHYGIDIGKNGRSGNVPVVAAESGTVIRSYYSSSYGNVVLISHNVDGRVVTTVYAHLENRAVSDGESVSKGQYLGNMGNTGRSFGAHLHFEVHEGAWNASKSNAVDPLKYIPN
ncbi:MAG TPA: peptidoglycan DD-metalloendopeptidase family protein [Bacilli bacterium]|nr:peptidoglycan DD-metalloendopeptidase family protein [Bacilli bacterium]